MYPLLAEGRSGSAINSGMDSSDRFVDQRKSVPGKRSRGI